MDNKYIVSGIIIAIVLIYFVSINTEHFGNNKGGYTRPQFKRTGSTSSSNPASYYNNKKPQNTNPHKPNKPNKPNKPSNNPPSNPPQNHEQNQDNHFHKNKYINNYYNYDYPYNYPYYYDYYPNYYNYNNPLIYYTQPDPLFIPPEQPTYQPIISQEFGANMTTTTINTLQQNPTTNKSTEEINVENKIIETFSKYSSYSLIFILVLVIFILFFLLIRRKK